MSIYRRAQLQVLILYRSAKKEAPSTLSCNGEKYNVFPQILEICSSRFTTRFEHVEHENHVYVNLDALEVRGVQVFADWAMDHQKPIPIAINEDEGDIFDDVISCYITALRLRATLLCDLIIHQACEIGKDHDLAIRHTQIARAYAETKKPDDALRAFVSSLVAYQRRNGLDNAITGKTPDLHKQRLRFAAAPDDFQFDLMSELSKNTAAQNPCYRSRRFLKVVGFFMQRKEEKRAAVAKARLEEAGAREEEPLFVDESEGD